MNTIIRAAIRSAFALAIGTGFAVSAQAQQVKMSSAQQARVADGNVLTVLNPSSTASTCVSGTATWAVGDFLVAVVTMDAPGAAVPVSASGFTQHGTTRVANGVQQTVLYRRITGPTANVSFNWAPPAVAIVNVYAFKGVNAVDPFADAGSSAADTVGVATAPATAGAAGSMHVMVLGDEGSPVQTMGSPSPSYTGGCDSINGRYGRLLGSMMASPTSGKSVAVGMYAKPFGAVAIPSYTVPTIGTSNIGTAFVLKP